MGGEQTLRVGIAGFGGAGMAHAMHFRAIAGCEVTAVYDPKPAGLERARRMGGTVHLTQDLDDFLGSPIDVVSVCSPNHAHGDHVVRSLQAGKHVICEKPMVDSLADCGRVLRAARAAPKLFLGVTHQMRFLPLHRQIRSLLQARKLGAISYAEGYYVHNVTARARLHDDWMFTTGTAPLVCSGCHFVDLLRWLLDDEVVEVFAMANHEAFPEYPESDLSVLLMKFRSGVIGKVVTAFAAGRPQDHSVRIYGSERSVENNLLFARDGSFELIARPFLGHRKGAGRDRGLLRSLKNLWRDSRENLKSVAFARVLAGLLRLHGKSQNYATAGFPLRVYEHSYAVRSCLEDCLRCIRTGSGPVSTAADAAKTVATCLAGVESYRTGRPVRMEEFWIPEFAAE